MLSVISITDLFFVHKSVVGALYLYFESATIVMVIYLVLTLVISNLLRWLERKIDGADSYDLATTDTLAMTSGMYNYPDRAKAGRKNAGVSDVGNTNLDIRGPR